MVKANPKDSSYFLTVALCWSGTIAGWVIFGVKGYANWRRGDASPTSGDADRQRQALKTSLIVAHAGFLLLYGEIHHLVSMTDAQIHHLHMFASAPSILHSRLLLSQTALAIATTLHNGVPASLDLASAATLH